MSLLSQIRQLVTVDVDSMDPAVAIQHTTAHEKFCDMTSNQAIVYGQCARPDRISVVKTAIEQVRAQGVEASQETFMSDVIDDIVGSDDRLIVRQLMRCCRQSYWLRRYTRF